ncbi:GtrA family protein [Acerihabitans sp. KWT182]|uniref:GtrA family protein n=1 Tax=Acerihabitans sp. KWT182 TaxID=3157919 RepID=A0AAU7Q8J2_9GAMM
MPALKPSLIRFLLSGGINTALTYGIYSLLLMAFSYTLSFTLAYGAGIFFAYVMNRFFVFKHHQGLKSIICLPFVYALQYGLSMTILYYWVEKWGMEVRLAPVAALTITLPLTYFFSKLLFEQINIS